MEAAPEAMASVSFVLFRAKSPGGNSVSDRYKPKLAVYHLSEKFDPEAERTKTLCGKLLLINWGVNFLIIPRDEADKIQSAVGNPAFCPKCTKVAMVINDIGEQPKKEEKGTSPKT
jgi:hypothetical protein